VDVQKDLLTKIKNQASLVGVRNVDIVWADIENLGGTKLRDQSIDGVIAANIFFQLDNKEGACREIKRILKRSGRVFLVDWASSFGGMGPEAGSVFDPSKAKDLFIKNDFELDREITAGAQHYGLIFRKK
jgi:ubiquinone/menaquinone biosynthesis C-methylase UbiE